MSDIVGQVSPTEALMGHEAVTREASVMTREMTTLPNGVRVLTEKGSFPGNSHFGILIDAGTRDETDETSGLCNALKTIFLGNHSDEGLNYSRVLQSGGDLTMLYDQERIFVQGQCLPSDSKDFMQMMVSSVFSPRSLADQQQAHERLLQKWKLHDDALDKKLDELLPTVAYGPTGLGRPLMGVQSNVKNLTWEQMNEFRETMMTGDRIIVVGGNVDSHNDFLLSVGPYFDSLKPVQAQPRVASSYLGGDFRIESESETLNFYLAFEGVSWKDPNYFTAAVLKTLIGQGGGFSSGGPGKGMHSRSYTHILPKYPFIDSIAATNTSFSDSGIFGIKVIGLAEYGGNISEAVVRELADLVNITELEVQRAKNLLKTQILLNLEKSASRVEEGAKSLGAFGRPYDGLIYTKAIDRVTRDQLRALLAQLLASNPTLLALGGDTSVVPKAEKFGEALKGFSRRIKISK